MCVDRANGAGLATLENWQTAPWNRWSLQHMSEIIPSARISRSEGPILDLLADPQAVDLKGTSIPIGGMNRDRCTLRGTFIPIHAAIR